MRTAYARCIAHCVQTPLAVSLAFSWRKNATMSETDMSSTNADVETIDDAPQDEEDEELDPRIKVDRRNRRQIELICTRSFGRRISIY